MTCPHCQAELPEPSGRFCEACGLASPAYRLPQRVAAAEPALLRCPDCGLPATARRCRSCGSRVSWPEGTSPADE